jgi:HD-GYP domain-containing protein (c-di-GMP phosphodiesterase class II)
MSDRHYRKHLSLEETRKQLELGSGTQFDKQIVDTLIRLIDEDPVLSMNLATSAYYDR